MSPTVPLVIVLLGTLNGRCPSPVPRWDSAKICTSRAFWLPSGCGIAALPTKEPSFTSASVALTMPTTAASLGSMSGTTAPSSAFTLRALPSTFSIVPRTRTVCCAKADETEIAATRAAQASVRRVVMWISVFPGFLRNRRSHRRRRIPADIDARHRQGAVGLLGGGVDEDLGARLELGLVCRRVGHDRAIGADRDLLLALLVFERERVGADPRHHLVDRRIGHGALRLEVPGPMAFAGAAHRLGEDVDLHAALAAVGLRHAGDADEGALLDVGIGRLYDRDHHRIVGELGFHVGAFAGLDGQHRAIDGRNRAAP